MFVLNLSISSVTCLSLAYMPLDFFRMIFFTLKKALSWYTQPLTVLRHLNKNTRTFASKMTIVFTLVELLELNRENAKVQIQLHTI